MAQQPTLPLTESKGLEALDAFEQKRQAVREAGLTKRANNAGLTPAQQLASEFQKDQETLAFGDMVGKYGMAAAKAALLAENTKRNQLESAARQRTPGELLDDVGSDLAAGAAGLVAGIPVALQDAALRADTNPLLAGAVAAGKVTGLDDTAWGETPEALQAAREAVLLPQQKLLGQLDEGIRSTQSSARQSDEALMAEQNARFSEASTAIYKRELMDGRNAFLAGMERVGREAQHGAGNLLEHPKSLTGMIVQQAPTLLVGPLAKAGATTERIAAGVAERTAKLGLSRPLSKAEAAAEAALSGMVERKLTNQGIRELVAATEGGSNYAQVTGQIANTPIDKLAAQFPGIQEDLDSGKTPDEIRAALNDEIGLRVAGLSAVTGYLTGYLSQGFLRNPLGKGVPAGKGAGAMLSKISHNLAEQGGEVAEEALQGGLGQYYQNVARQDAGDVTVEDALDGVGSAAGQGALAALGTTAVARGPGLALDAASMAGRAALKGAATLVERGKAKRDAGVESQRQAAADATTKNADILSTGFTAQQTETPDAAAPVSPMATPAAADESLLPADLEAIQGEDTQPLNKVQALAKAINTLDSGKVEGAQEANLKFFALKAARELSQQIDSIADPAMKKAAQALVTHQTVLDMEAGAEIAGPELVAQKFAQIPDDVLPEGAEVTPEVRQALSQMETVAANFPDKLTPAQTGKLLAHRNTPITRTAHALAQVAENYRTRSAALAKQYPTFKSIGRVTDEILSTGFQLGKKKLPSLTDLQRQVVRAMGNNDMAGAEKAMTALHAFAQSRIQRAKAFNDTVLAQQGAGNPNEKFQVPGTKMLDSETTLGKNQNWVNQYDPASMGLVDAVHGNAQAAVEAFDALAANFPDLVQGVERAPLVAAPAPAHAVLKVADAPKAGSKPAPAAEPVEAPVADRRTDNGQRAESTDRRDAKDIEIERLQAENAALKAAASEKDTKLNETIRMLHEAETDPTTGLPTKRVWLRDSKDREKWAGHGEADGDGLKYVNDTFGHSAGDALLQAIGEVMRDLTTDTVKFFRTGGDEFSVLASTPAEAEAAMKEAQKRLDTFTFETEATQDGKSVILTYTGVGISVGAGANHVEADNAAKSDKQARKLRGVSADRGQAGPAGQINTRPASEDAAVPSDDLESAPEESDQPGSLSEHLSGLAETLGEVTEDMTPAQKNDRANKFLTGFRLVKNSLSPLVRFADFRAALKEALANDDVQSLYVERYQNVDPSEEQVEALERILTTKTDEMVKVLNQRLRDAAVGVVDTENPRKGWKAIKVLDDAGNPVLDENGKQVYRNERSYSAGFFKQVVARLAPGKDPLWVFPGYYTLHASQFDTATGEIQLQPKVAEAVAMAALHWVLTTINAPVNYDADKVSRMFPDGVPPQLQAAYDNSHMFESAVSSLSEDIAALLGVKAKGSLSVSYANGLPKALALDAVAALQDMGVLQVDARSVVDGLTAAEAEEAAVAEALAEPRDDSEPAPRAKRTNYNTLPFLSFNKDEDSPSSLQGLRARLGQPGLLTRLLFPESTRLPTIGTPPAKVSQTTNSTRQKASRQQRTAMKNKQDTPHFLNMPLLQFFKAMGKEYARLVGVDPRKLDGNKLNVNHDQSIEGVLAGMDSALDAVTAIELDAAQQADMTDTRIDEIGVYNAAGVVGSNARNMDMPTVSQQSSKYMREVVSTTKHVLDLADQEMHARYLNAVAQALGEKTEQTPYLSTASKGALLMARPSMQSLLQSVKEFMAKEPADVTPAEAKAMAKQMHYTLSRTKGGATDRAIHAVVDYVQYLQAKADGTDNAFTSHLAFEIDGKTDGPINALVHFGLWAMDSSLVRRLTQGGLILNRGETSLNELGAGLNDLYTNASNAFRDKMEKQKAGLGKMKVRDRNRFVAAMKLFTYAGHIKFNVGDLLHEFSVARTPSKEALTPLIYGAGEMAVLSKLAGGVFEKVYASMSDSIGSGRPLPKDLQKQLYELIDGGYPGTDGPWVNVKMRNLGNVEDYAQFTFTPDEYKALRYGLKSTIGKVLVESVREEVQPALDTFNHLYVTSAAQVAQYRHAVYTERDRVREQQIADGTLGPKDALSRDDENAILDKFRDIAPVYALLHTTWGDKSEGIDIVAKGGQGDHIIDGKEQRVSSITESAMTLPINTLSIEDAGVRIAALLTQALGDATMMTELLQQAGLGVLDVFDGVEVSPDKIKELGKAMNEAVLKGWMFDGLGSAVQSQAGVQERVNGLPRAELEVIAKPIAKLYNEGKMQKDRVVVEDLLDGELRIFVEGGLGASVTTLERRAKMGRAMKKAIFDGKTVRVAVDHMAGAQNAVLFGQDLPLHESDDIASAELRIAARAYLLEEEGQAPAPMKGKLADLSAGQGTVLGATETADLMDKIPPATKTSQFVWNQIKHLLPPNLQVHLGTPEQIAVKQAELFPGVQFNGEEAGGETYFDGNGGVTVFVQNGSEETLLHELIHAATFGLLARFYANGKGLTAHQKDAVRELEKLARAFRELSSDGNANMATAQSVVEDLFNQGKPADAINEFMAYTLSDPQISAAMAGKAFNKEAFSFLKVLAKKVIALVRKALGLPNNGQVATYLEQTLGQLHRLARRPYQDNSQYLSGEALGSLLASRLSEDADTRRMTEVLADLDWVVGHSLPDGRGRVEHAQDFRKLERATRLSKDALLRAGFKMNDLQEQVFTQMHTVLSSIAGVSSTITDAMAELYQTVLPTLKAEDFLADSDNMEDAEAKLKVLTRSGVKDAKGRDTALANFIALALVDPTLRDKLAEVTPENETQRNDTLDQKLKATTTAVFDYLADWGLKAHQAPEMQAALDRMVSQLRKDHQVMVDRVRRAPSLADQAETRAKEAMAAGGEKLAAVVENRKAKGKNQTALDKGINRLMSAITYFTSDENAAAGQEALQSAVNASTIMPAFVKDVIGESIGRTKSNGWLIDKLDQAKSAVAQVRQRLREEAPIAVREMFSTPLSREQWAHMHKAVKADLGLVMANRSLAELGTLAKDPKALAAAIAELEGQLTGRNKAEYLRDINELASYLVTGKSAFTGLARLNSLAIAHRVGAAGQVTGEQVTAARPIIDELISLRALELLDERQKATLSSLIESQPAATERLFTLTNTLAAQERAKPNYQDQRFNALKGFVPEEFDPRHKLVLASPDRAKDLVKQGYQMVAPYAGDADDVHTAGMAYYAVRHVGGETTYNQGAMQIVEGSVAGVDALSGRTKGAAVQTAISDPRTVDNLITAKRRNPGAGDGQSLLPIYDEEGTVIRFQRTVDPSVFEAHMRGQQDLSEMIGVWLGRQAEERLAYDLNGQVIDGLSRQWEEEKATRGNEYVDVTGSTDKVIVDTWNSLPKDVQEDLREAFGKGPVMIRREMLGNALGYHSASVADVFTGITGLPEPIRKGIENVAYALFGEKAYRNLVLAERLIQAGVGTAKDIIVVRSGVVALANFLANNFQLIAQGVPLKDLVKQFGKVRETETYLRRSKRQAQITLEVASTTDKGLKQKLRREAELLHEANTRLSIWPLIEAGELPSIAEGLSKQNDYGILADASQYLEQHLSRMPKGAITAAKYAVIAKDTALYQGLNRAVQFGDFVAKATLYDHLIAQGMKKDAALAQVNDGFVNYNLLAGRSRDYLESMGATWFWNYKIRIQKIIFRTLRQHPLRFLATGAAGAFAGVDTLMAANSMNVSWNWSVGWGQGVNAHNMLMYEQLF